MFDGWEDASWIACLIGRIVISEVGKIFWGWGDRRENDFNRSLLWGCSALRR